MTSLYKKGKEMAKTINAGRILYLNKGVWDSAKTYFHLDMVNYNNIVYVCRVASTTQRPLSASGQLSPDWDKFIEQTAVAKATSQLAGILIVDGKTIGVDSNGVLSAIGADGSLMSYDNSESLLLNNIAQDAIDEVFKYLEDHCDESVDDNAGAHGIRYKDDELQKYNTDMNVWEVIRTGHDLVNSQADLDALDDTTESVIEASLFKTLLDKAKLPRSIIHVKTTNPVYMTGSTEVKVEYIPAFSGLIDPYVNFKKYYFNNAGKVDIEVWSVGAYNLTVNGTTSQVRVPSAGAYIETF